jgi:hypothetical protein
MSGTRDTDETATADEGGELDLREAAALVEQTKRQARRQFEPRSPLVAVLGAGVFLCGYGAVWWSMRDQHPYTGPAGWAIALLYALIAVSAVASSRVLKRATTGVGGRARRQMHGQAAAIAAAGVGAWVFQGALRYLGVSFEIVYGVYGPTVPLIALCAAAAGFAAAREDWLQLGVVIAIIAVAAGSAFFGPLGAWGLTGLGCCLALMGYAAALAVRLRRP